MYCSNTIDDLLNRASNKQIVEVMTRSRKPLQHLTKTLITNHCVVKNVDCNFHEITNDVLKVLLQ